MSLSQSPPPSEGFRVLLGNKDLQFTEVRINDPVPTGRQLLEAAGVTPVREHLVYQILPSGELEELRDSETTDLRENGVERFVVFKSDRAFRFELDERRIDWGAPEISGLILKKLAGVDVDSHTLWLDVPQGTDREVGDAELVSLTGSKTERFYTSRNKVTLIVNLDPKQWSQRRISYEQVTLLAFPNPPPGIVITYTVEYEGGPASNPQGSITAGESVKVKDGMIFSVTETGRS